MQLAIDIDTLVPSFPAVLINDQALSPVRWHTYARLPAACKRAASRPTSLLYLQCRGTVCGHFGSRSLYFHFVTARVRENHEIAQGSRWGTLFSVTPRKSFVITQLKSYPVKIESNISSPHPLVQGQSSLFAVSYFSRLPPSFPFTLISYVLPLLPSLLHCFTSCLIWCMVWYFDVITLEITQELDCT